MRPPACGELLKAHRLAANLTQEALAERARSSVRAISDLERGLHRTPQKDTVHLRADALQLSAQDRAAFEAAARRLADSSAPHLRVWSWPAPKGPARRLPSPIPTSAERPMVVPSVPNTRPR